jgi:acetylornithine deacetylase/succinyl-diaminopimelate desuccinylase-like protein
MTAANPMRDPRAKSAPYLTAIRHVGPNRRRFVTELKDFVRFPTVSAQSKNARDVQHCAGWLANHLKRIGLKRVNVFSTPRHPIVYAESKQLRSLPTVLIYGHYDVQPPDPLEEWHTPPFQPEVRGRYLYGRGASDDKGQLFAHIKAVESYLRVNAALPVNVKLLFEGEEEVGSPSLTAFLSQNRAMLYADAVLISDTAIVSPAQPAIAYSMRGALAFELELSGPKTDLHSGIYGGAIPNPLQELCEIIAGFHDKTGRIKIPGFYDEVRSWGQKERSYMANVGPTDQQIQHRAGIASTGGKSEFTLYERMTIRPSISVNGITGGYQGEGSKAVIPARAKAKISMRLVPSQQPDKVEVKFRQFIADMTPPMIKLKIEKQLSAHPSFMNRTHPVMQAAATAYQQGFGVQPVFLRNGGTIPVVDMFRKTLAAPVVLMGFGLPDDHIHGPNEKFHLPTFFNAIKTSIVFLEEMRRRVDKTFMDTETYLDKILEG